LLKIQSSGAKEGKDENELPPLLKLF